MSAPAAPSAMPSPTPPSSESVPRPLRDGLEGSGGRAARVGEAHAVVLAERGEAGYRQFRIPALLRTLQGTLLALSDGRPLLDDLPSPIDLLLRRSEDEGLTWGPWEVLRTGTGLEGFGDASLLQDPVSGALFAWHVATTRWGFFESEAGLERTQDVDVSVSHDDGRTWQHRRLTPQLKRPGIRSLFPASGAGLALEHGPHRGRLLQPMVVMVSEDASERIASAVAYSDDHGLSWSLGEPFALSEAGVHSNEHSLAQLPDGSVVSCSRATPARLWSVSLDGGATFGTPRPEAALPDPSDNGSVTLLPGTVGSGAAGGGAMGNDALGSGDVGGQAVGDGSLVAVTHNRDRFLRCNTAVTVGRPAAGGTAPEGAGSPVADAEASGAVASGSVAWGGAVALEPGASGYSTAVALPGGDLGVLLERGAYEQLVFVRVPRSELEEAALRPAGGVAVSGPAAAAVAGLPAPLAAAWSAQGRPLPGQEALHARVVPRSITPAPPLRWELRGEHVFLSGEEITVSASEGKEKGAAGAQVVASREDLQANLGPVHGPADALPGHRDVITLSASARWDGQHAVLLTPRWEADGAVAGDTLRAEPGREVAWLHLSRPLGAGELRLRWDVSPA